MVRARNVEVKISEWTVLGHEDVGSSHSSFSGI
jgi:hypothetical protein